MYCIALQAGQVTSVTRITDESQCAAVGAIVTLEPTDVPANPFVMSTADGLLISGAITTVWCLAWGIRTTRRALD